MRRNHQPARTLRAAEYRPHISRAIERCLPAKRAQAFAKPLGTLLFEERRGGYPAEFQVLFVYPGALPVKPALRRRERSSLGQFGNVAGVRERAAGAPEERFGLCCHY
jgi:hypothetical protein